MTTSIKNDLQALRQSNAWATSPRPTKFQLDESEFSFVVECESKPACRVAATLLDSKYPCALFVSCEDASETMQAALATLNEDKLCKPVRITEVVDQVLELFKAHSTIGVPRTAAQAGQHAQHVKEVDMSSARSECMDADPASIQSDDDHDMAGSDDEDNNEYDMNNMGSDDGYADASDDGDDDQDAHDDEDEEDRHLIIECGKRQGRWERYEQAKAEAEADAEKGLSAEQAAVKKQQIFDAREAFLMLSGELIRIFKQQSYNMFVDTVSDDVYHWAVELSGFSPTSGLGQDMAAIQRKYNYTSVRLSIKFMRQLHPFYPAQVEVVRPHLRDWAHGAVTSHPMLQLSNWEPLRPQLTFIEQLKTFLETNARVDLDSSLNDIAKFPSSSYRPVERYLAQLEALTGITPLCVADTQEGSPTARKLYELRVSSTDFSRSGVSSPDAGASGRKRGRSTGGSGGAAGAEEGGGAAGAAANAAARDAPTYWARGTGYGHGKGSTDVWDNNAAMAAQAARDNQLLRVYAALTRAIQHDMGNIPELPDTTAGSSVPGPSSSSASAATSAPSRITRAVTNLINKGRKSEVIDLTEDAAMSGASADGGDKPSGQQRMTFDQEWASLGLAGEEETDTETAAQEATDAAEFPPDTSQCLDALMNSCVVPMLVQELKTTSFSDMCQRQPYYIALMKLLLQLCRPECTGLLARTLPQECLGGGTRLADALVPLGTPSEMIIKRTRPTLVAKLAEEAQMLAAAAAANRQVPAAQLQLSQAALADLKNNMRLALLTNRAVKACSALTAGRMSAGTAASGSQQADAATSAGYAAVLRPYQVVEVELPSNHKYSSQASKEGVQPSERVARLGREIAGLCSDLPLTLSSSVFVRVDESNMALWRALITGPDDTPYSGGCFIFDMYFPPTYPNVCPQVNLKTTGGGTVRFNPNLYNCGKVCLSLLGTWSGGKGESWMPGISTSIQVLLSIQSLIFVEQPYFNEPGYESSMNSQHGKDASKSYNQNIREATIRFAMVDLLKHPPPEFKDVIQAHFRLKKTAVLRVVDSWIQEASSFSRHLSELKSLKEQLQQCLDKL